MSRSTVRTRAAHPTITLADVTRAEITKILTTPAIPLACVAVLVLNTTLCALSAGDVVRLSTGSGPARLSDLGALMLAPVYVFLVVPVHAAGDEYVSGQLRVTLAAVPRRGRLLVAKQAALLTVVIPAALGTLAPGRVVVAVSDRLSPPAVLLDLARWTAVYVLLSCVAYALAHLLQNRVAPLTVLALVPLLVATGVFPWPTVVRYLPDQLGLSLLGTPGYEVTALPPTTAATLLVGWVIGLLAAHVATTLHPPGG